MKSCDFYCRSVSPQPNLKCHQQFSVVTSLRRPLAYIRGSVPPHVQFRTTKMVVVVYFDAVHYQNMPPRQFVCRLSISTLLEDLSGQRISELPNHTRSSAAPCTCCISSNSGMVYVEQSCLTGHSKPSRRLIISYHIFLKLSNFFLSWLRRQGCFSIFIPP